MNLQQKPCLSLGGMALLHPPPLGRSKWPGLLLALCLACESRDRRLLDELEKQIECAGRSCAMLMRLPRT